MRVDAGHGGDGAHEVRAASGGGFAQSTYGVVARMALNTTARAAHTAAHLSAAPSAVFIYGPLVVVGRGWGADAINLDGALLATESCTVWWNATAEAKVCRHMRAVLLMNSDAPQMRRLILDIAGAPLPDDGRSARRRGWWVGLECAHV